MKKVVGTLTTCLCLIAALCIPAFAANKVNTIDISAVLYEDGSLYVLQVWEGDFEEGTELYIPIHAPNYLTISDLQVADFGGSYETLENWDVDKGFEEKAAKCGISPTPTGYEICFGISQYGHNRYAIEYRLANVAGGYADMDGMNFRFVNDGMNTTPTDVKVEIRLADGTPITDETADIWSFGYEGQVEFLDGAAIAYTQSPIDTENHVTVLLGLKKGVIFPQRQENSSFEAVKQQAFEGSDYGYPNGETEEANVFEMLLGTAILVGSPIVFFVLLRGSSKKAKHKKQKRFSEKWGYFREVPNQGNLGATYALGRLFDVCEDGAILATGMLRLIQLGCLSPVETQEVGLFGKTKQTVSLQLMGSNHHEMNEYDEYLYTVLEGAAGLDAVLQAKELERFADQNDRLLRAYIQKYENAGKDYLHQQHCLKRWRMPAKPADLTLAGEKELGELIGLKRYLTDFSLIAQRGVKEMPIWRELLTYAMLFGIADQVAEQMKALYPQNSTEIAAYSQSMSAAYSYHHLLYKNMQAAEDQRRQAKRIGGGGGFASLGGGGGSIGGGSGGGTR